MTGTILALHPSFSSTTMPESSTGSAPMRLVVAEPAEMCRMGVHRMLECAAPAAMVTSVASWWAVSQIVLRDSPSMLLISSDLDGTPDTEVARALRTGGTAVVLLARSLHRDRIRSMLK